VDPVVLGEAGVSVYEIPKEKTNLPVEDWVDVEDLGMDDDTYPKDVGPVKMATPAPNQKVWLASNVHRMSPMPYGQADITTDQPDSEVDIMTDRPDISTAKTPKARSTRRQGRSFMSPEGNIISEARMGTIPYMAVWVMFFCILLTTIFNSAMALGDHDRQVIAYDCGKPTGMRAYDTGKRNHWCDLNPLADTTNTNITMTNVSYVLLQKVPRVTVKIKTCKIVKTVVPLYCGHYDHQTFVTPLAKWGVPSRVPIHHCQQYWLNKEYISSAVSSRHPLEVNATTIVLVETKGRTWVTEEGEVKCKGEKFDYEGKHYEDLVISHRLAITLVEDTALINSDGTLVTNQEEIILACQTSEKPCATYLWDTPTEQEKCLYFKSRRTKGTVVTTEAGDSTYMSTDGSMVRLLLKEEPIAACGRLVTGTNYPTLFLAKPQDSPSIGGWLNPQDATVYTYINNQDDYLYHMVLGTSLHNGRYFFCSRDSLKVSE
jgi:hypothetical protein